MATPPPELQQAINNSSQTYGVPTSVLTRVWNVESGGNFPNPYVNSSGYGGLFGTKIWDAPTQQQSDYAASILQTGYGLYGNWEDALSYYRTGQPGKGYPGGGSVSSKSQSSSGGLPGIGDIGGAISGLSSTIGNIPTTIAQDTQHLAIGAGLGTLAVLLIISGIFIIIFTSETGRAAASSVPKVVPVPV